MASAEQAVRDYLTAVNNPSELKDEQRIAEIERKVAETDDVIESAKLLSQQFRLAEITPEDYVEGFVEHSKRWADDNDVSAPALRALGVPADVLKRAGFDVAVPSRPSTTTRTTSSRRTRSTREQTDRLLLGLLSDMASSGEEFSITAAYEHMGRALSRATVGRYLKDPAALRARGEEFEKYSIEEAGVDDSGPGRAAQLFRVEVD